MIKYYIKDGYSEKGPLTVDDLKKLKISKTTYIRQEENCNWVHADSLQELKIVFKNNILFSTNNLLLIIYNDPISSLINLFLFGTKKCWSEEK